MGRVSVIIVFLVEISHGYSWKNWLMSNPFANAFKHVMVSVVKLHIIEGLAIGLGGGPHSQSTFPVLRLVLMISPVLPSPSKHCDKTQLQSKIINPDLWSLLHVIENPDFKRNIPLLTFVWRGQRLKCFGSLHFPLKHTPAHIAPKEGSRRGDKPGCGFSRQREELHPLQLLFWTCLAATNGRGNFVAPEQ